LSEKPALMNERRPTLAPLLNVRGGARAVAFYKAAFGAEEIFVHDNEGDVVAHLSVHGADFWLADESTENQNFSPDALGGSTARLILTVDDPDGVFARAVTAGARILWPVEDQSYGWRVGRVVDPFGHHWEIGKPIPH
jgi:PhnB protein